MDSLTMGLIGIVVASLVNLFIQSSAVSTIVSYIGVLVFVGLTAYDTQDVKNMAIKCLNNQQEVKLEAERLSTKIKAVIDALP
jgi:FtsH-binding integral membrane protein